MNSKDKSGDANKQPEKGTGWATASVTKPFETAPVSFEPDKYEFRRNISSQPAEPRAGDKLEEQRTLYNREVISASVGCFMDGGTILKKGGFQLGGARGQATTTTTTTTSTSGEAGASSSASPPQPPVDYVLAPKDNLKKFIDDVEIEEAQKAGSSSDPWTLPDSYKFAKDQLHAWGTGFYIGNLVVATNAHCVLKSNKDQTIFYKDCREDLTRFSFFVFGYTADAVNRKTIPATSVFMIERILFSSMPLDYNNFKLGPDRPDWALIKLRPLFEGQTLPPPLELLDPSSDLGRTFTGQDRNVWLAGHPWGSTKKLTDPTGADSFPPGQLVAFDSTGARYSYVYRTNLKTTKGNSGSPTFIQTATGAEVVIGTLQSSFALSKTELAGFSKKYGDDATRSLGLYPPPDKLEVLNCCNNNDLWYYLTRQESSLMFRFRAADFPPAAAELRIRLVLGTMQDGNPKTYTETPTLLATIRPTDMPTESECYEGVFPFRSADIFNDANAAFVSPQLKQTRPYDIVKVIFENNPASQGGAGVPSASSPGSVAPLASGTTPSVSTTASTTVVPAVNVPPAAVPGRARAGAAMGDQLPPPTLIRDLSIRVVPPPTNAPPITRTRGGLPPRPRLRNNFHVTIYDQIAQDKQPVNCGPGQLVVIPLEFFMAPPEEHPGTLPF